VLARIRILSVLLVAGAALLLLPLATAHARSVALEAVRPSHDPLAAVRLGSPRATAFDGLGASTFGDRFGFGFGSALVGSAPTGDGPSLLAIDSATHTAYVVNGDNANGPNQGGDTVSVIDLRRCNADDVSDCRGPWATVTVGNDPTSVAVDEATDTVYVSNGGDFVDPSTVSVFNGATCNAEDRGGCGQMPAEVPVGVVPIGIYADSANHTVYVPNAGDTTVSMIDTTTCNAAHLGGCPTTEPPTVSLPDSPDNVDVDPTTHTVYVAEAGGVGAFNANTCKATTQAGCGTVATLTIPSGDFPFAVAVDPANQTLYTANGDNTISVFDLRDCNASDLAGCATDAPGTVTVPSPEGFDASLWVAADTANHTVYVPFYHDDALMVLDADVCNGRDLAACATIVPREIHTSTEPESVVLDPQTQTLYTGDEVDDAVSVIAASACDAQTSAGCRPVPPTVAFPQPGVPSDDPAVHTLYVPSTTGAVGMLDTDACNAERRGGCPTAPITFAGGDTPYDAIVNPRTHTVYIANAGNGTDGSVSVIDDRTCNITTQAGCSASSTLAVPAGADPIGVDVDLATDTIYVAPDSSSGIGTPTYLYVFNGSTCNATTRIGCSQTPDAVPLGDGAPAGVSVDQATNTVYVAMLPSFGTDTPGTVAVIDGLTCDATRSAGCAAPLASIPVGVDPQQVAVDQATDTVYTANEQDTDYQGTASIIDAATCNSTNQDGCGQTAATAPVGFGPLDLAIDQARNRIWVENTQDTSISIVDGAVCDGEHEAGCARPWPKLSVLDYPSGVAFADNTDTAYIAGWTGVTVLPLPRRGRP
jgi:DNA-binding beta-propeller fold protein YncE